MIFLFDIGFLPIRFLDLLDIAIVGYLAFLVYKLLRGSVAFNIFIGVILLYFVYWLVGISDMNLLHQVLGQFVSVGFIILIIIFQPEIRRFLLLLGDTTIKQRSNFFSKLLQRNEEDEGSNQAQITAIKSAMVKLSKEKTGALIVVTKNPNLGSLVNSGTRMDAHLTEPLLLTIFNKETPLHDGAVIIYNQKILSASCVLPVSDNPNLPRRAGLRHRAAVGITENSDVASFVVSEESGNISYAHQGKLSQNINPEELERLLTIHYN